MSKKSAKVTRKTERGISKKQAIDVKIARYLPKYRKAVEEICWETAFFGEKGTPLVEDKQLIIDFLCKYYFEYEKDKIFVALSKGRVVGYLFGCADTKKQQEMTDRKIMPELSKRFLKGGYSLGLKTFHFLFTGLIWYALFEGKLKLPLQEYPAHLHMNVTERFRRYGIGTRLIKAYFEYLFKSHVKGLHLITTSHHKVANPFYRKLSFKIYNKKPTKMWSHVIKETVYFRIYVIKITKALLSKWGSIAKSYK